MIGKRKLDRSFLCTRIEVLTSFDVVGKDGVMKREL